MEIDIAQKVLLITFVLAMVMGAIVNKTNFCTMGAVSDLINIGDAGRFRSWIFAIAIALLGVCLLEFFEIFNLDTTRPPYRTSNFSWSRYIIGGFMFGIGMTLASGCGNKILIRIGGGNLKSVLVLFVAGIFAFVMTKTDFYGIFFYSWMNPVSIDLGKYGLNSQDVGSIFATMVGFKDTALLRLILGGIISLGLFYFIFKSKDFRHSFDNILGGLTVGLIVLAGWVLTGGGIGQAWISEMEFAEQIPLGVGVQSFTFINPMGETFDYFRQSMDGLFVTFGVISIVGVIAGSLVYSILSRKFRIEWFSSLSDFINHFIGATFMGIGGILAMGCTIGQGVTGISTLAVGSIMVFAAIVLGSSVTMKIQYYRMVYEGEATFIKALLSTLVDLRILPNTMRKLDAI